MIRSYLIDHAGKNVDILLGGHLFEKLIGVRMEHRQQSAGELFFRLRDFEALREFFSSSILVLLADCPFIILFMIVIAVIASYLVIIPLIGMCLVLLVAFIFQKPIQALVEKSAKEMEKKYALLTDCVIGIESVKGFNAEGKKQHEWERCVDQIAETKKQIQSYTTASSTLSLGIQNLTYIGVIILGVYMNFWGDLTLGGLIACSILTSRCLSPIIQLVGIISRFNQTAESLQTLDRMINMPLEHPKGFHFLHKPKLSGDIGFQDIRFNYPGQKLPTLRNLSIKIRAGEKVGILGRIGSGKSTLEKILMGLYQPSSGFLLFDGADSRQLNPSDVRNNIGYVPQEVFLFRGTIRENILMGKVVTSEQFDRAAEISGVTEFTSKHHLGFDMPVGESGSALSGGQRQAVAIARAIVNDPPILVFDEPSSSMDPMSEYFLTQRLKDYIKGKTVMMISHRTPILSLVSRLIIIEGGQVVIDGPRDEVLAKINAPKIQPGV
jgi:ATP-binding cassette subfamily C protein LapB